MNRRNALKSLAISGAAAGVSSMGFAAAAAPAPAVPLRVPSDGHVKVAFMVSESANVMDLAGPWETFQDMILPSGEGPFQLYTVAESSKPITTTGGLQLVPTYSIDSAPKPNVVVIGAQSNHSDRFLGWIRDQHGSADVIMSVCTGAFKLAMTGLLDGKSATTHHEFYDKFSQQFPRVRLVRGERFVDNGDLVCAGGLTSGISAAMHVVERYFGSSASTQVARYMEFTPTPRQA
jgi:transcriptional regulator GlxA family with amidase domain